MRTLLVIIAVALGAAVEAQTPAPAANPGVAPGAPATATADRPGDAELPVSLERIRRDLDRPDVLRSVAGVDTPVFRVEVTGVLPRFSDFVGGDDALRGYAPFGGLTHNEFLQMVTPPQMRPYGAFTNGDLVQVLATSLLSGLAMQGAAGGGLALVNAVKRGLRNREENAARAEVHAVLAELERRRLEEEARRKAVAEEESEAGGSDSGAPGPPPKVRPPRH